MSTAKTMGSGIYNAKTPILQFVDPGSFRSKIAQKDPGSAFYDPPTGGECNLWIPDPDSLPLHGSTGSHVSGIRGAGKPHTLTLGPHLQAGTPGLPSQDRVLPESHQQKFLFTFLRQCTILRNKKECVE